MVGSRSSGWNQGGGGCADELVGALSTATDVLLDLPVAASTLTGPDLDAVLKTVNRLASPRPYGPAGRAGLTTFSSGNDIVGGITAYRMQLNPESRAVVESAVNALSRPVVAEGLHDARTAEQRRGDALVEVCRRAVTLRDASADVAPVGVRATVLATISMDDLRTLLRPGALVGGLDAGTLLGPETVRQLACDGALVPAVLGTEGEVLHLGRARRLFSSAQVRALWLRDRHGTFPGCTVPAT